MLPGGLFSTPATHPQTCFFVAFTLRRPMFVPISQYKFVCFLCDSARLLAISHHPLSLRMLPLSSCSLPCPHSPFNATFSAHVQCCCDHDGSDKPTLPRGNLCDRHPVRGPRQTEGRRPELGENCAHSNYSVEGPKFSKKWTGNRFKALEPRVRQYDRFPFRFSSVVSRVSRNAQEFSVRVAQG